MLEKVTRKRVWGENHSLNFPKTATGGQFGAYVHENDGKMSQFEFSRDTFSRFSNRQSDRPVFRRHGQEGEEDVKSSDHSIKVLIRHQTLCAALVIKSFNPDEGKFVNILVLCLCQLAQKRYFVVYIK